MTLQERIEDDLRQAIKNQDRPKKDLIRVLLGEITKKTKTPSDEEVIKCIKKQIESAKLCHTEEEIPFLEVYLPKEMNDLDYFDKLIPLFAIGLGKDTPGEFMKRAKEILGKDFDGKRVSAILNNL